MCQTMMRMRGLKNENVPGFIEQVPFGPDEVEKLRQRRYVVLSIEGESLYYYVVVGRKNSDVPSDYLTTKGITA